LPSRSACALRAAGRLGVRRGDAQALGRLTGCHVFPPSEVAKIAFPPVAIATVTQPCALSVKLTAVARAPAGMGIEPTLVHVAPPEFATTDVRSIPIASA